MGNMKHLGDILKSLQNKLEQELILNLNNNNLGTNSKNLMYLAESMKYFPNSLEKLGVYLS